MSKSSTQEGEEEACEETEESEKRHSSLYIFPNLAASSLMQAASQQGLEAVMEERTSSNSKGHARSASHGGVASFSLSSQPRPAFNSNILTSTGRASALKKPGHKRAFSQGQLLDMQRERAGGQTSSISGHSRVGSKTDFILPPTHREDPRPLTTAGRLPSFRCHSRQASRSESIYTIRRSAVLPWWRRLWAYYFGSVVEEPNTRIITPRHLILRNSAQVRPIGREIDNRIRTTKYNALTFIPRNLFEQFHRVANIYFLFIVFLNWIPAINAFGKEIAVLPVSFVLGVTALKDYFEDRRRRASDRRVNDSTCRVYVEEGDRYVRIPWKDIKVGDFVHLSNNEMIPADLLLLRSSDPQGVAYLDTCNLDGETNLKQRHVVRGFLNFQESFEPSKFRSIIEVDKPSTKIYRFHGAVVHPNGTKVPVSTENLLLRESCLKNTDFVEGIVIYVGHETKAMLNNGGPRYKRSRLEQQMNLDVVWCIIILIVLCIVGAAGCKFWLAGYEAVGSVPFLPVLENASYEGFVTFWTFVIILQVMIPLSLYVTLEMAKLGQVYHIMNDRELYDAQTNRTAECRALNITEELGQVQYIFSDKTGTLTENKMVFRRCAVGGQDYVHTGEGDSLVPCTRLKEDLLIGTYRHRLQEFLILLAICNTVVVNYQPHHDSMDASGIIDESERKCDSKRFLSFVESRSPTPVCPESSLNVTPLDSTARSSNSDEILNIQYDNNASSPTEEVLKPDTPPTCPRNKNTRPRILNLPVMPTLGMLTRRLTPLGNKNHLNCDAQKNGKHTTVNPSAIYEAESPDELALVNTARAYNVKLIRRTPQTVTISLPDKSTLTFEILKILPFDSNRKCMSIVVKQPHTDEIVVYSKGADSTILGCLSTSEEDTAMTVKTKQQLHSYARQGLRTLLMARRNLSNEEFERWQERHAELEASGGPGENSGAHERRLRESYTILESQMSLLGASGIEDKLQFGVPEAVHSLVAAGIVVWVLTGDKLETAVNVAYSARLFSPSTQLLRLQARSKNLAESLIRGHLEAIERDGHWQQPHQSHQPLQRALVVDGKTLTFILDPRSGLTEPFLELTRACSSVLACRATPLQKAYIVKVAKEQLRVRTLAIGDGANDVSMIQTADVGIGLSGQEGMQAVMAADFVIARFYMLTRLLLVHGHWCYDRLSRMILYFFYKNAICVFLIFWFQLYCGFSGAVMIDQIYLMLYNLSFTALPPLILGIYDQIAPASLLVESPRLYDRSRTASVYQPHSFWVTMADAVYQSIVIFFLAEAVYHDSEVDIWEFGTTIMTCCIIVTVIQICIETKSWTIIHVVSILGSLGFYFAFIIIYNAVCVNCMGLLGSYWVAEKAIGRHVFWLTVILASFLAVLPRVVYKAVKNTVSADIMHRANAAFRDKKDSFSNQRVTETRKNEFVAGWSQSSQDATITSESFSTKNDVLSTIIT